MTSLLLFFVGAVLFINGLTLLGRVQPKAAAPLNAVIGLMLIGVTAYLVVPLRDQSIVENRDAVVGAVGFLLFGITHLALAHNFWTGCSGCGLGWYCLWATGVSAMLAVVNFVRFDDARFGALWVLWAALFGCFFLVSALERERLVWGVGWVTAIQGFLTTTIPGALLMLGEWTSIPEIGAVAVCILALGVFAALLRYSAMRPQDVAPGGEPEGLVLDAAIAGRPRTGVAGA